MVVIYILLIIVFIIVSVILSIRYLEEGGIDNIKRDYISLFYGGLLTKFDSLFNEIYSEIDYIDELQAEIYLSQLEQLVNALPKEWKAVKYQKLKDTAKLKHLLRKKFINV